MSTLKAEQANTDIPPLPHHGQLNRQTGDSASWHAQYADSAYVYIGGLDQRLSEGDVITIFSQYGEVAAKATTAHARMHARTKTQI